MNQKTMEDALEIVPNRFQLTMMAVARAKEINEGEAPLDSVEANVKPVVHALKEIAEGRMVPATREAMSRVREARRVLRERTLMEAEKEEILEDDGGENSYASAHPDDEVVES